MTNATTSLATDETLGELKTREKTVRIILEESDEVPPNGQFIQFGSGHLLRSFVLRAGEPADVPEPLLNVLNDAVMQVPVVDPSTRQVVGWRERMRFPYRILSGAA